MRALTRLYPCMYVCLPKVKNEMNYYCYDIITLTALLVMGIISTLNIIMCFGTTFDAGLEIMSRQSYIYQPLYTLRSK